MFCWTIRSYRKTYCAHLLPSHSPLLLTEPFCSGSSTNTTSPKWPCNMNVIFSYFFSKSSYKAIIFITFSIELESFQILTATRLIWCRATSELCLQLDCETSNRVWGTKSYPLVSDANGGNMAFMFNPLVSICILQPLQLCPSISGSFFTRNLKIMF